MVGRDPVCDVAILEATVSRQHLRVYFDGNRILLEDLGSSNGTVYYGIRLAKGQRVPYEPGEKVKLGLSETYVWFESVLANKDVEDSDTDGETEFYQRPVNEDTQADTDVTIEEAFLTDEVTPPPAPATTKAKTLSAFHEELSAKRDAAIQDQERTLADLESRHQREIEARLDKSIQQRDDIITTAMEEAESTLASASEEAHKILERTRTTAEMIRKTAEEESRIIRERKGKELATLMKTIEDRTARILEAAEIKKSEILKSADIVLQEANRDAEERIQQAKKLFSRVEAEAEAEKRAIVANSRIEVSHLDDEKTELQNAIYQLKTETAEAQRHFDELASLIQGARHELERSQVEHADRLRMAGDVSANLNSLRENLIALEAQQSEELQKLAELQRQNEHAAKKSKEQGEEILRTYEKTLNAKLEKESQIMEERRLELSKDLASKEESIKKAFAERTIQISKSLTQFLQIYHIENKTFDFKSLSESQTKEFETKLREALLIETKTMSKGDTQVVAGKIQWTKKTKMYAAAAVAFCLFVIVPLVQVLSPSDGADRYIASLKNDRDRRYTPEKVDYVFENFSTNAMYSKNFIDKWLSDSYQRQWSKKLQYHFYKKYRIAEEVMIQVTSKEAALIENYRKAIPEIHPDFFKVQFAKMQKDEQTMNSEIRRLIMSEAAFQEYKQMTFTFYSENKDK